MGLAKRDNLIKILSFIFAFCVACVIYFIPTNAQAETANFSMVQGASIRNEEDGIVGLKFQSTVNAGWLTENNAEKYTFGTLIYPASNNQAFDSEATLENNIENLDAVSITHIENAKITAGTTFNASIVYDEEVIKGVIEQNGLEVTDELVEKILFNLYNKDFTARSYAVIGEEVIYTDSYTTSMYKVAIRTYELGVKEENEAYKNLALNYLGLVSEETATVTFVDDTLNGDYTADENSIVTIGNKTLVKDTDYSINENGKIVFPADYTKLDTTENVYLINSDKLTILTATYGTDVKSVSEVFNSNADDVVVVKGYFAGLSTDNLLKYGSSYTQLMIKDTENDSIISFNTPQNLTESYGITKGGNSGGYVYDDFKTLKYQKGDYVVLKGTFRTTSSNNTNRKDVRISTENPDDINKTIISRNNVINYSFENAVLLDEWSDWTTLFTANVEAYTYVRIKGTLYTKGKNASDYTDINAYLKSEGMSSTKASAEAQKIANMKILHMNADATAESAMKVPGGSVVMRRYIWTTNLGFDWEDFFVNSSTTGIEVDMYALYTGRSSVYTQLTPLEVDWLNVHDHVYDNGEEKATCTVSGCGYSHYHQYKGEWQTESLATVLSKGVEYRTCIAKDCNKKEYRETELAKPLSIQVTTNPSEMYYNSGEKLDITGMVVTATGDNGTTADVTQFITVEDKTLTEGDSTVTISYQGLTTTLTLNMVSAHDHVYEGNYLVDYPATIFSDGLEYRQCTVYKCSSRETRVIPKVEPTSIEITANPTKTKYFVYEEFDATGLEVTAYGANDYSEVVTEHVTISSSAFALGENTVTITFEGFTKTLTYSAVAIDVADVKADVADDTKVLVEGYFVGVADEGYQGDREMLIKDINTDDIIAVRGVSYDTFDKSFGYTYGDKVRFIATLKTDGTTYTVNKKYLVFSNENGDKASTILSSGNQVNYSLENAVELDTYHDWNSVFTRNSSSYTYVHITGLMYSSIFTAKDSVDSIVISSEVSFTGSYNELKVNDSLIALRKSAMDINLGNGWADYFGKDYLKQNSSSSYTGPGYVKEVDIYAVFTGGVSNNFQLTILSNDWIKDVPVKPTEELTTADIIKEVAFSYYRQNSQIQYNQTVSRRNINAKPEDATTQHLTYLDCSSFVGAVIKESLGIEIIPESVVGTEDTKYPITSTYPQTGKFATYAKNFVGNPDYPDIIKFITKSQMDTEAERLAVAKDLEENLQPGDVINYRKSGNGSGHVILYIGDGLFIHCQGDDYNEGKTAPSTARDATFGFESLDGAIGFLTTYDVLYNTEHTRYIVSNGKSENISWFRPIIRADAEVTDTAIARMQYRGLDGEKTLDVGVNSSVQPGQILTYTVTIKNHSTTDYTGVEFKDVLDSNVTLVEAPNGYVLDGQTLTLKVDVPHYEFTTFTYKVKVSETATAGTLIVSDKTTLVGVTLAKIVNAVSGYTVDELNSIAAKAKGYASTGASFENPMDLVADLYSELGVTAFDKYTTIESLFDELMNTTDDVLNDVEIASYVAPNLYGGRDMSNNYIRNKEIIRLMEEYHLSVGDIILAEFDLYNGTGSSAVKTGNVVHVIYVYVGNSQLVCLTDDTTHAAFTNGTASEGAEVNKCFTITMLTENPRRDTHVLTSVFTYDRWAVIRPSMVA